ncbi:uncharacterized protein HaLaN_23879 [Haematococcus lacustris]|uniref:Uncharacterized protein n=1 Tax=Haematococcus lacustris TaxID=44745 RepID=A0A699ZSQ4_HAELA|nr:uncharacterized protein HaLaN_23879 [Haematococcus lacustris]
MGGEEGQRQYLRLLRRHVLPGAVAQGTAASSQLDGLFCRSTVDQLHTLEPALQRLFTWYATLDDNRGEVSWERVQRDGLHLNASHALLFAMNFEASWARAAATPQQRLHAGVMGQW